MLVQQRLLLNCLTQSNFFLYIGYELQVLPRMGVSSLIFFSRCYFCVHTCQHMATVAAHVPQFEMLDITQGMTGRILREGSEIQDISSYFEIA